MMCQVKILYNTHLEVRLTLEKTLRANALFDVYGGLLTDSQKEVLISYIADNDSFGEIADRFKISRQAVSDIVNRALDKLEQYESKLHLVSKLNNILAKVEEKANSLTTDCELAQKIALTYTDLIKSLED